MRAYMSCAVSGVATLAIENCNFIPHMNLTSIMRVLPLEIWHFARIVAYCNNEIVTFDGKLRRYRTTQSTGIDHECDRQTSYSRLVAPSVESIQNAKFDSAAKVAYSCRQVSTCL